MYAPLKQCHRDSSVKELAIYALLQNIYLTVQIGILFYLIRNHYKYILNMHYDLINNVITLLISCIIKFTNVFIIIDCIRLTYLVVYIIKCLNLKYY